MHFGRAGTLLLLFTHLVDHVFAQAVVRHAELLPPVGQHNINLAGIRTQAHKVKGGAKPGLVNQAERGAANPLLKARLHHPYFAHVAREFAAP